MASNTDIINAFIDCWSSKNIDEIMAYFTPDAVYTNIPIDPPNVGTEAIRAAIEGFVGMASEIKFVVHHQAETSDGTIMNERTDKFLIGEKWVDIAVMGIFELSDGKITAWRDYFDMGQFTDQM